MKDNCYIENLQKLGLSEVESKVYLNLFKKKNFTATEISRLSGVHRTKIYEVLHQLVNKGLCFEILGNVNKYSPTNPSAAIKRLIQKSEDEYKQELEYKNIIASNISDSLSHIYNSEKGNTAPLDYIQIIRNKSAVAEKFEYLHKTAKEEILCFAKSPFMIPTAKYFPVHYALKNKLIVKSIYEIKDLENRDYKNEVVSFIQEGEQVKFYEDLPIKMMVFDRKIVLLGLVDNIYPNENCTTLVIEHKDIANTFIRLFDNCWKKAIDINDFNIENNKILKEQ